MSRGLAAALFLTAILSAIFSGCSRGPGQRADVARSTFYTVVFELVREDLAAVLSAEPGRDGVIAFVAGAFIELLTWSLEAKRSIPPDEVDALFHELVAPVLAAAGGRSPR